MRDRSILCQECRKTTTCSSINELPINHSLMKLPSAVQPSNSCLSHNKPLEAFCLDSLTLLCMDCLLTSKYKDKKVVKIDQAYKDCMQTFTKDTKTCEAITTKGNEVIAQLTNKICSYEKKFSLKKELADFYDSIIDAVNTLKETSCGSFEKEVNTKNEAFQQNISNIRRAQDLWEQISECRRLDKLSFLKRYKQVKEDMSLVHKIVATLGPKMIPEDLKFDSKKELDNLLISLRSNLKEFTRPSTTPHQPQKEKTKKPPIPLNNRPQTAINKTPSTKQDTIKSPKKDNTKQPPPPNNLQQKRAEMKNKKQASNPSDQLQTKNSKANVIQKPTIAISKPTVQPETQLTNPQDTSHLTLQFLNDQKLSLLNDSILPSVSDNKPIPNQNKGKNSWNKRGLPKLEEETNLAVCEVETCISDFHKKTPANADERLQRLDFQAAITLPILR
jgi:hypothetical protein